MFWREYEKKRIPLLLAVVPIAVLCILYIGGLTGQFIANYETWQQAGGTPGNGISPQWPDPGFLYCLQAAFVIPSGLYGIICGLFLFALIAFILLRNGLSSKSTYDHNRHFSYSEKGTYGTSGFMSDKEMSEVLEAVSNIHESHGTILGQKDDKIVCLPENSAFNKNIVVLGSSGSRKTRSYVVNAILQTAARGDSLLVTDPKSELFELTSVYLEQNCGYEVKILNLVNILHSDRWNCIAEINGDQMMAQVIADVIIKNTGSSKGDHFWDAAEQNLLKALILYVEQGYPQKDKNLGEVYKLLTNTSAAELDALFSPLPFNHPAKAPYNIYKQAGENVRGGVIIGLGSRLQVMQNQQICDITAQNDMPLEQLGQKPCAYFCVVSDQDSTFDFLSSLFLTCAFIKLIRLADQQPGGRLPIPVHILGEELMNCGSIPDLTKKSSTIRSRALYLSCICQNLPQFRNRYPYDQWQEILGNCDTMLVLGCTDEMTATMVSSRTGDVSVDVSSTSKHLHTWQISNYTPEYRETSSIGRRKLLTPDEVLRLPLDTALVILRGQKVLQLEKYDYSLHPEAKYLVSQKASEYLPSWTNRFAMKNEPRESAKEFSSHRSNQSDGPKSKNDHSKKPKVITTSKDSIMS